MAFGRLERTALPLDIAPATTRMPSKNSRTVATKASLMASVSSLPPRPAMKTSVATSRVRAFNSG